MSLSSASSEASKIMNSVIIEEENPNESKESDTVESKPEAEKKKSKKSKKPTPAEAEAARKAAAAKFAANFGKTMRVEDDADRAEAKLKEDEAYKAEQERQAALRVVPGPEAKFGDPAVVEITPEIIKDTVFCPVEQKTFSIIISRLSTGQRYENGATDPPKDSKALPDAEFYHLFFEKHTNPEKPEETRNWMQTAVEIFNLPVEKTRQIRTEDWSAISSTYMLIQRMILCDKVFLSKLFYCYPGLLREAGTHLKSGHMVDVLAAAQSLNIFCTNSKKICRAICNMEWYELLLITQMKFAFHEQISDAMWVILNRLNLKVPASVREPKLNAANYSALVRCLQNIKTSTDFNLVRNSCALLENMIQAGNIPADKVAPPISRTPTRPPSPPRSADGSDSKEQKSPQPPEIPPEPKAMTPEQFAQLKQRCIISLKYHVGPISYLAAIALQGQNVSCAKAGQLLCAHYLPHPAAKAIVQIPVIDDPVKRQKVYSDIQAAMMTLLEGREKEIYTKRFFELSASANSQLNKSMDTRREVKQSKSAAKEESIVPNTPMPPHCYYMGCNRLHSPEHKFNKCSKCKSVMYCCKECQVLDWKAGHGKKCKPPPPEPVPAPVTETSPEPTPAAAAAAEPAAATTTTTDSKSTADLAASATFGVD